MKVFRTAKQKRIRDLSGFGASLAGGRWNHIGYRVVYASSSKTLSVLEYLVHTLSDIIPPNTCYAAIHIPDSASIIEINKSSLPKNWDAFIPINATMDIGTEWFIKNKSLLLKVPSALIDDEFNILINTNHPEFIKVKLGAVRRWPQIKRYFPSVPS